MDLIVSAIVDRQVTFVDGQAVQTVELYDDGSVVIGDGKGGTITVDPTPQTVAQAQAVATAQAAATAEAERAAKLEALLALDLDQIQGAASKADALQAVLVDKGVIAEADVAVALEAATEVAVKP